MKPKSSPRLTLTFLLAILPIVGIAIILICQPAATSKQQPDVLSAVDTSILIPLLLAPVPADLTIRFADIVPKLNLPGLTAAWTMDEGSGYEFWDATGAGHTAYITGAAWNTTDSGLTSAFRRAGKRGGAVYLNDTQWLQVQDKPELENGGQISISLWFKVDPAVGAAAGKTLLAKNGYALLLVGQNSLQFRLTDSSGSQHTVTGPISSLAADWVHVAATANSANGQMRIFVNGTLAGSSDSAGFSPMQGLGDLFIGSASEKASSFKGWIDEVTLHNAILSTADVRQLYITGLPKLYRQTRETIDPAKSMWTNFKGNAAVPHPIEPDTIFSLRFNGTLAADQGYLPTTTGAADIDLAPGVFGGAFNASSGTILTYPSPLRAARGTAELWFIPQSDPADLLRQQKKLLLRLEGQDGWIELFSQDGHWEAQLGAAGQVQSTLKIQAQTFMYGQLMHLGLTWGPDGLVLYLNGVEVGRSAEAATSVQSYNLSLTLGASFGLVDDLRISATVRDWGEICPRGHIYNETSALDLMDGFNSTADQMPFLWRPSAPDSQWVYAEKTWEDDGVQTGADPMEREALRQGNPTGFQAAFHPDAYGVMQSFEAGVSLDRSADGWAGVFIQAAQPGRAFSGYTFAINPVANQLRIGVYKDGSLNASKILPYDFSFAVHQTYALTLSHINDGVLRGYVDGNNLISMNAPEPVITQGWAGLFTEGLAAYFDDAHFSALTPASQESRLIEQRIFADGQAVDQAGGYQNATLNAFRWSKRYGTLPWQRTVKDPQLPGFISSADDGVAVPNPPAFWRSEDSAVSDLLNVNGKVLLIQRGNPRLNGISGVAQIGISTAEAQTFDGIHFTDPNIGITNLDQAELFRGNLDTASNEMRDKPPRDTRYQVNDQGGTYIGAGKVLVIAREFRNRVSSFPWYRRLVYNIYDVDSGKWQQPAGVYVDWSVMDATDTIGFLDGIDGTPDVTALRDPQTDQYSLFLFHQFTTDFGVPTTGITGLKFDAKDALVLDERYPTRSSYTKPNQDVTYGERVTFDNGIYYLNYNSAFDRIRGDWPDQLALAASLHPYTQPWVNSADDVDIKRPYFQRGGEFDTDNAAIWSGKILVMRGRYYLYYEAFHATDDVNAPYQNYDALQAGSRLAFATGN